jgi:hypothetical protein
VRALNGMLHSGADSSHMQNQHRSQPAARWTVVSSFCQRCSCRCLPAGVWFRYAIAWSHAWLTMACVLPAAHCSSMVATSARHQGQLPPPVLTAALQVTKPCKDTASVHEPLFWQRLPERVQFAIFLTPYLATGVAPAPPPPPDGRRTMQTQHAAPTAALGVGLWLQVTP